MPNRPRQMEARRISQETREDESMMEEEQQYQENIKITSNDTSHDNEDDGESSILMEAPSIHQVSEESRQQHESSPAMLSARLCDINGHEDYDDDDEETARFASVYRNLRSPEEERRISPVSTNFLRSKAELPSVLPPSFPPFLSDAATMTSSTSWIPSPLNGGGGGGARQRDSKPALLRSLAWSQDSQEERRTTKRRKEEPVVIASSSFNGRSDDGGMVSSPDRAVHHHNRRSNSNSPTMVHWEDEVMELSDVLQRAIQHGTPTRG